MKKSITLLVVLCIVLTLWLLLCIGVIIPPWSWDIPPVWIIVASIIIGIGFIIYLIRDIKRKRKNDE
jgi:hypothetical protein